MNPAATDLVPPVLAGPLNTIGSYGALGAIAVVFLLVGLYAFKRLFDRVLDSNDQAVKAALSKMDNLERALTTFKDEMLAELREMRHELVSTSSELVAASGRVEKVVEKVENSSGVYRDPAGGRRRG